MARKSQNNHYKILVGLPEVEGAVSFHQRQIDRALKPRLKALEYVAEATKLAEYLGGRVESLGLHEDWTIAKPIFPDIEIFFVFNRANGQNPPSLKVLYSGNKVNTMKGDDLARVALVCINHMLRFVRETNPGKHLPDICYKV
jgi:hypothetical protein